ncbi:MAG: glycosyltransferase family 1 protein [Actinomycetota bacterium]
MKIAYDAAPLLNPRTGVGQYAAALLDHLVAADPDLTVSLFAVGRQRRPVGVTVGPQGSAAPVRRLKIPARLAVGAWEVARHPRGEWLVGSNDVVHGTNFWVPPLHRPNGVVTVHDLTFLLYPEFCTPPVRRYKTILPRVLRRCAVVITPSETVAQQVAAELAFPRDRIVVTPEGVRPMAPPPQDEALTAIRRRLRIEGDFVLFLGTREPRKNLDRLLSAFAQLDDLDLRLVVAGPSGWGPGQDRQDLLGRAHELGAGGRIVVTGYLEDAALAAVMAQARAFAFPSIYEGFGLPPLEAMAAGVPVVAARAGSLPEVLGEAPFFCDPLDVSSIAEALRQAVTDEGARTRAIAAGRAQAARYDWAETARLTLEAYRQAAS